MASKPSGSDREAGVMGRFLCWLDFHTRIHPNGPFDYSHWWMRKCRRCREWFDCGDHR